MSDRKIVVELVSSADVRRLEEMIESQHQENLQLRRELEALRRSYYELLDVLGEMKRFKK